MHKYFVTQNKHITPTTLLLSLKKRSNTKPFLFQPGQYAAISFKHHHRPTTTRCFSIVSSPTEMDILQFSARSNGRFTKALNDLTVGDEVTVRGSFGAFVFDPARDKDAVLIAGGIGITPFLSMIRYATASGISNSITLLYSCQNQDEVAFADELKDLEKRNPHFRVVFVISQGPTDKFANHIVKTGRISPEILDEVAIGTYANKTFFVCGPPSFMKAMTNLAKDKGAASSRIITEAFSQGPNRQTGKIRSWPYNIYVLGIIGVVLSSFIVMVSDLLKTLPPSAFIGSSSVINATNLTNKRQTDLDQLVNGLPSTSSGAPATDAVNRAIQTAMPTTVAASATSTTSGTTVTRTSTTSGGTTTSTKSASTTSTAPAPTPAPAPKCTTTQSGVTTCV